MTGPHRTQIHSAYSASSFSAPALASNVDIVHPYTLDNRAPYHFAMICGIMASG